MKPTPLLLTCLIGLTVSWAGLAQPAVQFGASSYTVAESAGALTLTVQREGDIDTPVSVDLATVDGTATNGFKYASAPRTLMFGAGETNQVIALTILNNGLVEGTKSFRVVLSNPDGGAILGLRTNANVSITDTDVGVQFVYKAYSVAEGAGTLLIGISRGDDGTLPVTVDFATIDGTATNGVDYAGVTNTLAFGPQERIKLLSIPILNNSQKGADKTFTATLSNPVGLTLDVQKVATITIGDNDQGFQFEFAGYSAAEDAGVARINVLRGTDDTNSTVTVDIATTDLFATNGLDYASTTRTLSFAPGENDKLVAVPILNDGLMEPAKNFGVTLSNPTGGAILGSPTNATVTILDNDPGVGFELNSQSVWENAGALAVTVLRGNDAALGPISIDYATSNLTATAGLDYQAVSGTLAFMANETVKSIIIPIFRNGSVNAAAFKVTLNTLVGVATLGRASTTVTILDASGLTSRTVTPRFDTALAIRREGDVDLLTWSGGGQLQRADRVTGPWLTLATATSPVAVQSSLPSTFYRVTRPRPANVLIPYSYDGQTPMPLVIALHGVAETGPAIEDYFRFRPLAEARGFLYCYPDGYFSRLYGTHFWNATDFCCDDWSTGDYRTGVDDAGYLRGLIEEIGQQFTVDRKRIYLIGHSAGGFMAYRMACDSADLIAGIASLAGATFLDPGQCKPSEPVNILQIHGTADESKSYAGGSDGPPYSAPFPGALQTVQIWAGYNGATGPLTDLRPTMNLDLAVPGLDTVVTRYTNAPPGGAVELWTINGGRHAPNLYSGSPASELAPRVIDWLLAHPKP